TTRACLAGPNVGKACTTLGATCAGGATCADVLGSCGDGDSFGDPGERGRLALFLTNVSGFDLTGGNLTLSTADPDIQCVPDSTIQIPSFPKGTTLNTTTLSPGDDPANPSDGRFFEFVISPNTHTSNPAYAARASMTLTLTANEAGGTT